MYNVRITNAVGNKEPHVNLDLLFTHMPDCEDLIRAAEVCYECEKPSSFLEKRFIALQQLILAVEEPLELGERRVFYCGVYIGTIYITNKRDPINNEKVSNE